jgi:ATP-dependent DNA helicase RecG
VQKGNGSKLSKEEIAYLRKYKLVEGRSTNLYLSAEVAQSIDAEAQYIRNRAFDNQYYRDMIVNYLQSYGKASRQDIRNLLWDKLPDVLDDKQKEGRIRTLLSSLKDKGIIMRGSESQQKSCWVLVDGSSTSRKKK